MDQILLNSSVKICFSYELLSELHESTSKPKLAKHFGDNAIEEMLFALSLYIELVEVTSEVSVCRDPNDNFILALCKDADADFLLTGDKDLLALNPFGKTKILSIAAFISIEK